LNNALPRSLWKSPAGQFHLLKNILSNIFIFGDDAREFALLVFHSCGPIGTFRVRL
jgi:hypothetical protein